MLHSRIRVLLLAALLVTGHELNAATYYVACDTGQDTNDGKSELKAWRSASKAARFAFMNGDKILFKRGCAWEDVSIKITRSVELGAYGDALTPPQLIGATRIQAWSSEKASDVFSARAAIEDGVPSIKEILVVFDEKYSRFYDKVGARAAIRARGQFFHDVAKNTLYIYPLEGTDLQRSIYVSSKPHVLEFQRVNIENIVVTGLQLAYANEYAIGFWYQLSGARNGSLKVENCIFTGNAYQAIHIGGTNSFSEVDILNNTITANGHEGIYIGYIDGNKEGEVVTRMLRISGNTIGGQNFGWRSQGPESAANGDGIDIKKGVAAGVIDNNLIFDLKGSYGIGVQSSNVLVERNTIRDIHMANALPESNISAIFVDAYDNKGATVVRRNTLNVSGANGIVIRGHAQRRPRFEIYDNEISVQEPYFPFAFTSQNISNTVIAYNRSKGGRAALWVLRPCCTPANVEFHDNDIRNVSEPILAAQDMSVGLRMYSNIFCLTRTDDSPHKGRHPNNTFVSGCAASGKRQVDVGF